MPCDILPVDDLSTGDFDGIIFVCHDFNSSKKYYPSSIITPIETVASLDNAVHSEVAVFSVHLPCQRMVYAPVGTLNKDSDDVRSFSEAANCGVKRAIKAGLTKPLLVLPNNSDEFPYCEEVTLLGALEALYVPLQLREDIPLLAQKVKHLCVFGLNEKKVKELCNFAVAVEQGRQVARDIGGSDPERMTPRRAVEYLNSYFEKSTCIRLKCIDDLKTLQAKYPLFSAVNRAASVIPRHEGNVLWMEYTGDGKPDCTLMLVGKGVTYDTGGADIKAGGVMAGMSRDKCGAAAIAGFFKTLEYLRPKNIVVHAALGFVRNSVGENCYVADEVITSRSGMRVRVGNTDAEGRMVMADLLCEMKERAKDMVNPHLMTIATLTGHAVLTVGHGYSIVLDNSVASKEQHAQKLQVSSTLIGDPFEISTIRREDFAFHKGKGEGDDVLQCNNLPSSRTPRGHQGPAAFLILASGLDKNGLASKLSLKYSHLDIAAAAGDLPMEPTAAPIPTLALHYLKGRF